ncbi:PREDICTED: U3 small nucleolar RNA-associated protein 6 homolog [Dinoponera quadriceps]|uniref:U3 small nucleolar RNA-associated protein 6 homolog n=1 Tax=Dinoponera quadriceps TaxID=609295 RepID=A0A6P3Y733_DINQU|nr:PREDICTED: U3 small nucleolar RNA-associated protein 6 homolog [Dinoponera quadriceps]
MAEFVEKRCEDMIPELEQMERIKLFNKDEIQTVIKKYKEFEYKIQRYAKCRRDFEEYIHFKKDLLALIKQRRLKYGIMKKKSDIDFAVANKINNLYKTAINKFNDITLWLDYITFCKELHFYSNISHTLNRMLQMHGDKPRCWHIAACWELKENNDKEKARNLLLNGLHLHSKSQLLYIEAFRLELNDYKTALNNAENAENKEDDSALTARQDNRILLPLRKAYLIYQQAVQHVNDVRFTIKLLTIAEKHDNTEELQEKMISDMVRDYSHEALTWDKMARRELRRKPARPDNVDRAASPEKKVLLRDRIVSCSNIYQTALKDINTEEMWYLYVECLLDISRDSRSLANFKRKLLKIALSQAHQARKLTEKHYLYWFDMLSAKAGDVNAQKKLRQILREATDAVPNSVVIWYARMKHLLVSGRGKEVAAIYPKATQMLGKKALPLWKMRISHVRRMKSSVKTEKTFRAALQAHAFIAKDIKPVYLDWLASTKGIEAAREAYNSMSLDPPLNLELHKKMASLEVALQPNDVSVKHARRPHELATHLFGAKDKSVWLDQMKFEWKYGEPWNAGRVHDRALKTLDGSLTASFIEDCVHMKLECAQKLEADDETVTSLDSGSDAHVDID